MLHILTNTPDSSAFTQMQHAVGAQDTVLLVEEAVTAALNPTWSAWQHFHQRIYLLSEDLTSRGLANIAADNGLPTVDVDGFVVLTEQNEKTVTWY
ncbi:MULTISPECIES: sulfurtransferase complex subunit TusB [Halomonas]|uniref:Sulfurtransferase complex subunit TusB n=1 Tax=Halomonas casei TaxID=2742613 RepID=A0ABR9F206_9GAMM|nr:MULTISPECIES: sulfurtransferase complex subunit TusB [Halomonas]MBE0400503.1 sulfurtransferase complex subunit TusB [Halomonas casei]PCC22549.1 sulfurtransferase complex subunit TusB [Halomonas sp. JB37]